MIMLKKMLANDENDDDWWNWWASAKLMKVYVIWWSLMKLVTLGESDEGWWVWRSWHPLTAMHQTLPTSSNFIKLTGFHQCHQWSAKITGAWPYHHFQQCRKNAPISARSSSRWTWEESGQLAEFTNMSAIEGSGCNSDIWQTLWIWWKSLCGHQMPSCLLRLHQNHDLPLILSCLSNPSIPTHCTNVGQIHDVAARHSDEFDDFVHWTCWLWCIMLNLMK